MSVAFYGDYDTTETVIIPFNTFTSDDPSASCTITNLAAADVEIHKDGGTTQRASDNGVTVTINFDSITGNHIVSIDLSDNSDAGFYANGSRYQVRMEGTTIDGATVNAWIGSFSIGCTLRPTTAGRTLDVETGGCAGIDWANIANPTTAQDLSATDIQLCDTVTTLTGHTAQTGDTYGALPTNFSDLSITATTGRVDVGEWLGQAVTLSTGNKPDVNVDEISDDAVAAGNCESFFDGTGYVGGTLKLQVDVTNISGDADAATNLELAFDGTGYGFTGCTMPTVTTLTGHTPQTGDTYSELPTNFSDLAITVTTGRVDVESIEGSDATDQINAACDTALTDYDAPTNAEMTAAFTEIKGATWNSGTDTLEHIRDKETDIETDTQDLQTQIGTAGAGLTDLGGMSTGMKAEVNTECDTALTAIK